jgi:hypothetical protein
MKMTILMFLILLISLPALAPDERKILIAECDPVNPYERLIAVIVSVECNGDYSAYNPVEHAYGPFQIRPCRLQDYNIRTGSIYQMKDCFDYEVSRKIFLHYASKYRPDDILGICISWNGKSRRNLYYQKVISKLNNL